MARVRARKETGTLYFDFFYKGVRCREQTALDDTAANRRKAAKVMEKIEAEIKLGVFDYARHFPASRMVARFADQLGDSRRHPTAEAVRNLVAASVDARHMDLPAAPTPAAISPLLAAPTFKEFAKTWMKENEVQWRHSYRLTVNGIVQQHLAPAFGDSPVSNITRAAILEFRAEFAKRKGRRRATLSPRRVNSVMNILSQIVNEASDRFKFISPYYNVRPLKLPRTEVDPFSLDEVRKILEKVRSDYRDYFLVRFFTGMRTGEIDGLKWQWVDFEHRLILVRETIVGGVEDEAAKTKESHRDIQMSEIVYQALLRQRERTGKLGKYVFCSRSGEPLDHNNVTKRVWYPLLRHLGLKARRPYQSRHTAATLWLASGENPEWIARQMGHATTEMLFKVYSRYVPNLTRRDGSAFERLLASHFNPVESVPPEANHGE